MSSLDPTPRGRISSSTADGGDSPRPLLYRSDSQGSLTVTAGGQPSSPGHWEPTPHETFQVAEPVDNGYALLDRPDANTIQEIVGLLKVKTSMLALGACERIKKLARVYPSDIIQSPILDELIHIVDDGPGTQLSNAAMNAMATMALVPEGRQRIVLLGGAPPLIKLIGRCDLTRQNTDRAVQLLMNLAADAQNRRTIREAGGVEALLALMKVAPLDGVLEHAMGALHNVMLTDTKAKVRAVEAGVAYPLARVLAAKIDENHMLAVRARMLISDLLRVQDMQERLIAAAVEQGIRIPKLMPAARRATTSSNPLNSSRGSTTNGVGGPQGAGGLLSGGGSAAGDPGSRQLSNAGASSNGGAAGPGPGLEAVTHQVAALAT